MKESITILIYFQYLGGNLSRILFIGAHPDDIELGCAGTIYRYCKEKFVVMALIIAEGSSSRFDDMEKSSNEILEAIEERKESCTKALNILGVSKIKFYDLPCSKLDTVPILKINKIIENEIRNFRPDTVFTHSMVDTNKDHRIIFESTKIATRPQAFPLIKNVYCYEVLSSTDNSYSDVFKPNYFVSLSDEEMYKKIQSLSCYKSEMRLFPNSRSLDGITVLAKFRGMQINRKYAESFETLRSVI